MTKNKKPIEIYTWPTPNGHKIHIMMEECGFKHGIDWIAIPIDIGAGDQFKKEFLKISPNNKIPAMIDPNGPDGKPISLFESGAILLYLASKTNKFLPKSDREKFKVLEWLMFQMGGLGPMLGQAHHFRIYAPEPIEYSINRYTNEAKRLYGVLDKQLSKNRFIAGKEYSIADMAILPWLRTWKNQGVDMADFPHVEEWFNRLLKRPAVERGLKILADHRKPLVDKKAFANLFGNKQYKKH